MTCVIFVGGKNEVCERASISDVSVGDCHSSVLLHLPKDAALPQEPSGGREQVHQGKALVLISVQ